MLNWSTPISLSDGKMIVPLVEIDLLVVTPIALPKDGWMNIAVAIIKSIIWV
jgi:hypothetical protein